MRRRLGTDRGLGCKSAPRADRYGFDVAAHSIFSARGAGAGSRSPARSPAQVSARRLGRWEEAISVCALILAQEPSNQGAKLFVGTAGTTEPRRALLGVDLEPRIEQLIDLPP